MMKLTSALFTLAVFFSNHAMAEVAVTPRVSHSYERVTPKTKLLDLSTQSETSLKVPDAYFNSQRFDLEIAFRQSVTIEWLLDLGYMPIPNSGASTHQFNLDLGARGHLKNFYAQISLGQHVIHTSDEDGEDTDFRIMTAGMGAGYIYPLSRNLGVEFSYRLYKNIGDSNSVSYVSSETNGVATEKVENKVTDLENHQLGLGIRFRF